MGSQLSLSSQDVTGVIIDSALEAEDLDVVTDYGGVVLEYPQDCQLLGTDLELPHSINELCQMN